MMATLIHHAHRVLTETYWVAVEASPYILFGLLVAGVLYTLFPQEKVEAFLGRRSFGSVLKASLLGIPLPLCSCGVIPAATALHRRGASRGATTAFLISTPETGIESIALTFGLMGLFMAIVRPIAALITAGTAGILVNAVDRNESSASSNSTAAPAAWDSSSSGVHPSYASRLKSSMHYVFTDLLGDIGGWLILGVVLSGLIVAFMPADFFKSVIGPDWVTMLLMLVIGLPMYICASASTPIAAALMLKGASPGAALILLMVGPATNLATMMIVARELGKKSMMVYIASIVICSLLIAFAVNALAGYWQIDFSLSFSPEQEIIPAWIGIVSGAILLAFILDYYRRKFFKKKTARTCNCDSPEQVRVKDRKSS